METLTEKAIRIRNLIEKISHLVDDLTILEAPEICRYWRAGEKVEAGDRRFYEPTQKLYKVKEGMGHVTQADWTPDLTPAMWAVVALPSEDGTLNNPIVASRGMDYTYGLYYLDPEDNNTYLCKRDGEIEGTIINLQFMPHELIGHYFVLA